MSIRHTVCSYYPDLARPDQVFDFAVVAANPTELAAVGVNLAAFDLNDPNPVLQAIIDQTFDVLVRRIEAACGSPGIDSYLDVLDRFVEGNLSNIQYRRFETTEIDDDPLVVAFNIFRGVAQKQGLLVAPPPEIEEAPGPMLSPSRPRPARELGAGKGRPAERRLDWPAPKRPKRRRFEVEVFA
jgi:hypothetical protein